MSRGGQRFFTTLGGAGNYFDIPTDPAFLITGDIFMVFRGASVNWAPGGGSANDQELIVNSDLSGDGFRFFVDNTGIPTAYHGNGTITRTESLNPANLIDGVAIEIAVWYDVSAGVATWYKDGLIDATDTFSAGAAVGHTDPIRVGSLDGTLRPFLGDIYYAAVHAGGPGSPAVARYDAIHAFAKAESNGSLIPDGSTFRDDTGVGVWTSHGASVIGLRNRRWD